MNIVKTVEFDTLTYQGQLPNIGHILCLEDEETNIRVVRVLKDGVELFAIRSDLDQWGTWQSVRGLSEWGVAWEHETRPFLKPLIEALTWLAEWEPTKSGPLL